MEGADGKREKLCTAGLFVLVGGTPHTQWLAGTIDMDAKGYILTGRGLLRSGHLPSGWRFVREPFSWKQACRECLLPATRAAVSSSASRL
jgi:hypothetical protein